jgi:hypothetical protein
METLRCWLVCGSDGQMRAFVKKPVRCNTGFGNFSGWRGERNIFMVVALSHLEQCGMQLPLLTYADEPVEITISMSYDTSKKV